MNLSALIEYRNCLVLHLPVTTSAAAINELDAIVYYVQSGQYSNQAVADQLQQQVSGIKDQLLQFENTVATLCKDVDAAVAAAEPEYYQHSKDRYVARLKYSNAETIFSQHLGLSEVNDTYIQDRIRPHSNWQHAGLILRATNHAWNSLLVGCDPLYLVDNKQEWLDPAVAKFPKEYQQRLRTYVVDEFDEQQREHVLSALPDQQFGYCLAYNFFNFKPEQLIRSYLTEVYNKLKPGGSMGFTFNDCDRSGAVRLVETGYACYTPGRRLFQIVNTCGFTVTNVSVLDNTNTWVELRKPGELTTLRGGQTLAEIVPNNQP